MENTRTAHIAAATLLAAILVTAPLTAMLAGHAAMQNYGQHAAGTATPVIVELFTSEGCSSCPSAEATLARLRSEQPVAGARIILLAEHVDYFNQPWHDPYSTALFTKRQAAYARKFRLDDVYTPQAIVDGQAQFIGSDVNQAEAAISRAAQRPAEVEIRAEMTKSAEAGAEALTVRVRPLHIGSSTAADVILAVAEDHLTSHIETGENAGRTLTHEGVVRTLRRLGSLKADGSFSATVPLDLPAGWSRAHLRAVVFVQDADSARILGAAETPL